MSYALKEAFSSLQGEGALTGQAAVFLRFSACNLWSGREKDRASAACRFCDTDFLGTDGPGGGIFRSPSDLVETVKKIWSAQLEDGAVATERPLVILTGGEPLLQVDEKLVCALGEAGFAIAVETNGTLPMPEGIDWVSVSPKAGTRLAVRAGDELKLVYPQQDAEPSHFEDLDFRHFFLQPMDGPELDLNTRLALNYCLKHPQWRLSLQTHKFLGIP